MTESTKLAFLVDVDNTLLDNDLAKVRIADEISAAVGAVTADIFWRLYEEVRDEKGIIDFPLTCERLGEETHDREIGERVNDLLWSFDYGACVYPGAIEAVEHIRSLGEVVIVSDGDQVFQRHKIDCAGITEAAGGEVMIFVHKQQELEKIMAAHPADIYVPIEDKPKILSDDKKRLGDRICTVLVRQGKYAAAEQPADSLPPDIDLPAIAELSSLGKADFIPGVAAN